MSLPEIQMPTKSCAPGDAESASVIVDKSETISPEADHMQLQKEEQEVDEIIYSSGSEEEQDEIVPVIPKPTIKEEDVFVNEPSEEFPTQEVIPKKTGKRAYNRKKPMSEKQLAHLAKIRLIGVEKRKERAKEAREKKLLDQETQAEERLLKKKEKAEEKKIIENFKKERQFKENKLQEDYEKQKPVKEVPTGYFTKDDLDNAVLSAVETYDARRKKEKRAKKLKEKQVAEEKHKVRIIDQAINPNPVQDQWRHLFS
jgi:hypothetical protein